MYSIEPLCVKVVQSFDSRTRYNVLNRTLCVKVVQSLDSRTRYDVLRVRESNDWTTLAHKRFYWVHRTVSVNVMTVKL
jgi:hypothetical protein